MATNLPWQPLAALLLGLGGVAACTESGPPPLNLVVVLVDTARADHFATHGYARDTTPNLDVLAERSAVFDRHYSHASRTGPAVASIFTGLHPRSHGVVNPLSHWDAKGTLAPEQRTLAEILAARGYRTHGLVANFNVGPRFGFGQGFDSYRYFRDQRGTSILQAMDALDLASPSQPFFLYLHFMEPHSPYAAPEPFANLWRDPGYAGVVTGAHQQLDEILAGKLAVDASDQAHLTDLYDQEIVHFDALLGQVVQRLAAQDLLNSSLLVVVADHGEELFDHGGVLHGYTLYEEQLRVPLVVYDPRRPRPQRIDAVSRHVDLLPTLVDLLGLDAVPSQGRSLRPLLAGGEPEADPVPVLGHASVRAVKVVKRRSLLLGAWKYIATEVPAPGEELFDLERDPGETRNLIDERPDAAERLRRTLRELEAEMPIGVGGVVELSDEDMDQLRALGYVK